jgi:hypothetical protein
MEDDAFSLLLLLDVAWEFTGLGTFKTKIAIPTRRRKLNRGTEATFDKNIIDFTTLEP